jgi:hypothetical protein
MRHLYHVHLLNELIKLWCWSIGSFRIVKALKLLELWLEHEQRCFYIFTLLLCYDVVFLDNFDVLSQHQFFDIGLVTSWGPLKFHKVILLHKRMVLSLEFTKRLISEVGLDVLASNIIHLLRLLIFLLLLQNLPNLKYCLRDKIVLVSLQDLRKQYGCLFKGLDRHISWYSLRS